MTRQRHIFLIALACSLGLHVASIEVYVGWARQRGGQVTLRQSLPQELIVRLDDMGDATGTGIGSNSAPGERPLQAREAAEDQALLSRDPEGTGPIGRPPVPWAGPTGDGTGGVPAVAVTAPPLEAALAPERAESLVEELKPEAPRAEVASAVPLPEVKVAPLALEKKPFAEAPAPPAILRPRAAEAVAVAKLCAATGDGRQMGIPRASADPLPQSESDSDPFSRLSSVKVFSNGRLDVRLGRKVKTTRPQVHIAGQIDLIALNNPTVVLEVHIDRTGKVTDVKIAHSSGSNQIDEPTRLAVYDWWFEPARDKSGTPASDVIFFTVEFV